MTMQTRNSEANDDRAARANNNTRNCIDDLAKATVAEATARAA